MSENVNSVMLYGTLTSKVLLRRIPVKGEERAVANFEIAVGSKEMRVPIVAWGKTAENAYQYATEGMKMQINGFLDVKAIDCIDVTAGEKTVYTCSVVATALSFES